LREPNRRLTYPPGSLQEDKIRATSSP